MITNPTPKEGTQEYIQLKADFITFVDKSLEYLEATGKIKKNQKHFLTAGVEHWLPFFDKITSGQYFINIGEKKTLNIYNTKKDKEEGNYIFNNFDNCILFEDIYPVFYTPLFNYISQYHEAHDNITMQGHETLVGAGLGINIGKPFGEKILNEVGRKKEYINIARPQGLFAENINKIENLKQITNEDVKKYEHVIKLLKHLYGDKTKAMIHWLAYKVQNINLRNNSGKAMAFVLWGEQGTGKDLLISTILPIIFGEARCDNVSFDIINKDFNGFLENKHIVHISEGKAGNSEKFKSWISQPTIKIEPKGINSYDVDNYATLFFTSNQYCPVKLSKGDRRYCIVRLGKDKILKTNDELPMFFDTREKDKLSKEAIDEIREFFRLLKSIKYDFDIIETLKQGKDKEELQGMSEAPIIGVARDLVNGVSMDDLDISQDAKTKMKEHEGVVKEYKNRVYITKSDLVSITKYLEGKEWSATKMTQRFIKEGCNTFRCETKDEIDLTNLIRKEED